MKLYRVVFMGLLITFLSLGTASAGMFDSLTKKPGGASSASSGGGDIDSFLARAQESEKLVNASTQSLFSATASKEEKAKIDEIQKKMNETTDPKEKNKLQKSITATQDAEIQRQANDKKLQKDAAKWNDKQKQHVSDAFYNYALGAIQAGMLVPEGNNIISSVKSNPMQAVKLATKLDTAYESVTTLGGIAKGSVNTISALKKLMSAANISVKLPTSATEKAKPVDDKDME
jgi:hypothetical protein